MSRSLWKDLDLLFVLLASLFCAVDASLYPTKPVKETVYVAGQAAQVSWIEDGKEPLLKELGPVKIQLYAGNDTFLATIAKDLDPLDCGMVVYIPPVLPPNYHLYTLRFIPSNGKPPIYTSNFQIVQSAITAITPNTTVPVNASLIAVNIPSASSILSRITGTPPVLAPQPEPSPPTPDSNVVHKMEGGAVSVKSLLSFWWLPLALAALNEILSLGYSG